MIFDDYFNITRMAEILELDQVLEGDFLLCHEDDPRMIFDNNRRRFVSFETIYITYHSSLVVSSNVFLCFQQVYRFARWQFLGRKSGSASVGILNPKTDCRECSGLLIVWISLWLGWYGSFVFSWCDHVL